VFGVAFDHRFTTPGIEWSADLPQGFTIVTRIERPAIHLLPALILLLFAVNSPGRSELTQASRGAGDSVRKLVQAIRAEAKRIDAANDAPETAERHKLAKDLPHWQFSGLFENSNPVFLGARFSEGQVVREESYYLLRGKPILVKVEKWWDVDDPKNAPEPTTRQDFYIENDRTIRHVIEVVSSPPVVRIDNSSGPTTALIERSRSIAQILLNSARDPAVTDSLQVFPEAELARP
jgi:hypothetical protein